MENNSNFENENLSGSAPDENLENLKIQLDSGISQEDALEAMFRAAQEADKIAAKEAPKGAKKPKPEPLAGELVSEDPPQGGFLTVGDGSKSFSGESLRIDFEATEESEPLPESPAQEHQEELVDESLDMSVALQNAIKEAQESLERQGEWDDPFASENGDNLPVKKYIVYIDREFVKKLDSIDPEARNAYINDSLKMKLSKERGESRLNFTKQFFKHAFVAFLTVVIGTPIIFKLVNVSIDLTVSNYSYVQKNFENLYRERAEKGRNGRIDMR